ncbi:cupin [Terrimonas pollutisoli]|uniref:cupin n=1 Tax=Terrimonas pollutisoli TaxID=3034147 RepID=UPI0023ED38E9|nr:cupin [Terrimonas sp. H1YJ31]
MKRRHFLFLATGLMAAKNSMAEKLRSPETFYFKDDGEIPNSRYPMLLYRDAFSQRGDDGATWLEQKFLSNNWSNSWRNGIFSFHHYHSITHEVLGIYRGSAIVHMGGEKGKKLTIKAGDVIVIPAGVGHKNLESDNLGVVGAYPNGIMWDMNYGKPAERPKADENIAAVPIPLQDPLFGSKDGLIKIWS